MGILKSSFYILVLSIVIGLVMHYGFDLHPKRAVISTLHAYQDTRQRANFSQHHRFSYASPEARAFLDVLCPMQKERGVDINENREMAKGWYHLMPKAVPSTITEVHPNGVRSLWVTHPRYGQSGVKGEKTLLYLHGGGYTLLSPDIYAGFLLTLSRLFKMRVLAPDYRLAPENRLPAASDDAIGVYKYLLNDLAVRPQDIVVMGDSAGGGLTLMLLQRLLKEGLPQPLAALPMSPLADMTGQHVPSWEQRRNGQTKDCFIGYSNLTRLQEWVIGPPEDRQYQPDDPLISPLFGEFKGMCPLYLSVTDAEILYHDSVAVSKRARQAGVDVYLEVLPDLIHVYPAAVNLFPEASESLGRMSLWVEQQMAKSEQKQKTSF